MSPCEGFGTLARVPGSRCGGGLQNPSQMAALRGADLPCEGFGPSQGFQARGVVAGGRTPRRVRKLCEGRLALRGFGTLARDSGLAVWWRVAEPSQSAETLRGADLPCEGFSTLAQGFRARGMRAGGRTLAECRNSARGRLALRGFRHPASKDSGLAVWWRPQNPSQVQKLCEGQMPCEGFGTLARIPARGVVAG